MPGIPAKDNRFARLFMVLALALSFVNGALFAEAQPTSRLSEELVQKIDEAAERNFGRDRRCRAPRWR